MATEQLAPYTTGIIKAGALLAESKLLLASWDETRDVQGNLEKARRDNLLGKASRTRVESVLAVLRKRYFSQPETARALVTLVQAGVASEVLDRILYFHSIQADRLLHDTVTKILVPMRESGREEVSVAEIVAVLLRWSRDGQTAARWSEPTARRVAQGLLATLRDFGVLTGKVRKRLASIHVAPPVIAYITFWLKREEVAGERLLQCPLWQTFFLSPDDVERGLLEAHQEGLLRYYAAGSVVRIEFHTESVEEYAYAVAARSH